MSGMITMICECGDSRCTDRIRLPLAEYERVRGDSLLYVIASGHEFPEIESIVERARRPRRGAQAGAGSGRDRTGDRPAVNDRLPTVTVAHWDEVESHHRAKGEMDATWQWLGERRRRRAASASTASASRPGKLPTPPHSHGASEELYFVLAGSGLAWQDGDVHEVRPLDCVIHRPDGMEHTFVAGPDGLEYLVFGTRHPTELGWLPRSRAIRIGWPWVEGRDDDPWDIEATVEPLAVGEPAPRPANIVNVDEVEHESWDGRRSRPHRLRRASVRISPGSIGSGSDPATADRVPHCHSAEEEVFVILEGTATLELWQRGATSRRPALRAGHVVARPPGTRISHSFRAGPDGVTMLIYGTREPNDICWYPRSQKIFLAGRRRDRPDRGRSSTSTASRSKTTDGLRRGARRSHPGAARRAGPA